MVCEIQLAQAALQGEHCVPSKKEPASQVSPLLATASVRKRRQVRVGFIDPRINSLHMGYNTLAF